MKIGPDDASLSDLLRRFNLPLSPAPQRVSETGTSAAQAIPKPVGSKAAPATPRAPATPGTPNLPRATTGAATSAPSGTSPGTGTASAPDLGRLLDAVGGFELSRASHGPGAELRNQGRASERSAARPSQGDAAQRPEVEDEARFMSRVSPQLITRPGLLLPGTAKAAPEPLPAPSPMNVRSETRLDAPPGASADTRVEKPALQPEPRAALVRPELRPDELARHERPMLAEPAELELEMRAHPALAPRSPGVEMSTMQHWAAVEVSARALPRTVRDVSARASDPPKKGARSRAGASLENAWFGAHAVRSNAYAVVFTLLGLLTLFVMARSCSG